MAGLHGRAPEGVGRRTCKQEQITAGSKKLKQGFETHAENLKDLMAQSCRAGMALLSDLEVKAEELEAELASQKDMEDKVNKLNTLISDRLQLANATPSVLVSSISSRS